MIQAFIQVGSHNTYDCMSDFTGALCLHVTNVGNHSWTLLFDANATVIINSEIIARNLFIL